MNINLNNLAISKEVRDKDQYNSYRLFYGLNYGYELFITNLETKESKSQILKDKILPKDLEDLEEEDSRILIFSGYGIK